jgi:hypothetical protein
VYGVSEKLFLQGSYCADFDLCLAYLRAGWKTAECSVFNPKARKVTDKNIKNERRTVKIGKQRGRKEEILRGNI